MRDDGHNPNRGGAMPPACKLYDRTSGIAWVEFIQAANPNLPILLVTVEAGRA